MNCELATNDIESILGAVSELAKRGDIRVTIEHTDGGYRASMHTVSQEEQQTRREFYDDINRRLDYAEEIYAKLVHQEVPERAVRSVEQVLDTELSVPGLKAPEA